MYLNIFIALILKVMYYIHECQINIEVCLTSLVCFVIIAKAGI